MTDPRRRIPRTDAVLADPRLRAAADHLGGDVVKSVVTATQQRARAGLIGPEQVIGAALAALPRSPSTLRPVINATGVVLHTNLGRAPLSAAARDAIGAAAGYVDVEFDLAAGQRARRGRATLAAMARRVPDADATLVVNNGAAALVLASTALGAGREIIVSRGELVEIGDGFRLPDLIESTGAAIREVGTTNRTNHDDYARAIGPRTAFILKVHPSNFRIQGFTSAVPVAALAALAVPVVADLGSGLLSADALLPEEPDVTATLRAGAALVTCSADKLLGGPQAGLIFGRTDLVEALRRHPLARALRVDKLTLAALEATLAGPITPIWNYLRADPVTVRARCTHLAGMLIGAEIEAEVVPSTGAVGGGCAPETGLPGWAVSIPAGYAETLRGGDPPVVTRLGRGRCLLDLRCVPPGQDEQILAAVRAARTELARPVRL